MTEYSSVPDTQKHIERVRAYLTVCIDLLHMRYIGHDASKLVSPEVEMYDSFRPKLDALDIQSPEYQQALVEMGDALQHHYQQNRHHPEHFESGIRGMNLIDVLEMVCDWKAAADKKGEAVNMAWACKRFGIQTDEMLYELVINTVGLLK